MAGNEKKINKLLEDCHISPPPPPPEEQTDVVVMEDSIDRDLLCQWPPVKMKIPIVFLHKIVDFGQHVRKLLKMGINFYQPYLGTNYTRIFCQTFNDHRLLTQYFDKHQLPYHTFGNPSKRKMRVVVRGLHANIDLDELKKTLKSASIPVIRIHKMHVKEFAKNRESVLLLVVVPYNDEGKQLLRVKKLFGHEVQMELPKSKVTQCHRCQKWGHSQRYCHGQIKCVKCAGDHFTNKCTRDANDESPTCANCGGNHTASYRECFYCPESHEYKKNKNKKNTAPLTPQKPRELVTIDNYEHNLYKNVKLVARSKQKEKN